MSGRQGALVLLCCAAALVGGGCRKVVSEPVLERVVADLMLTVSGVEVEVDCPPGVTMRTDEDFFCHTEVMGRRGTVLVRQVDDYGHVQLENVSPLDHEEVEPLVEAYLRREHEIDTRVSCPRNVIQQPDENFSCQTRGHGDVRVRQVDGVDEYTFQLAEAGTGARG